MELQSEFILGTVLKLTAQKFYNCEINGFKRKDMYFTRVTYFSLHISQLKSNYIIVSICSVFYAN